MSLLLKLTGATGGATVNAGVRNTFITDLAFTISAGAIISPGTRSTTITDLTSTTSAGAIISPSTYPTFITDLPPTVVALSPGGIQSQRTRRKLRQMRGRLRR